MLGESVVCEIAARRKGARDKSQAPCSLIVARATYASEGWVVLRTLDESGRPPLVALLTAQEARQLADGLCRAAGLEQKA